MAELEGQGLSNFHVRNASQFHLGRTAAITYVKTVAIDRFAQLAQDDRWTDKEKRLLTHLGTIYGLWQARAHSGDMALCGMAIDAKRADDTFKSACQSLKDDAVALADCLAPPDFVLNSTLGHSSGMIYEQMWADFTTNPHCFDKPDYWLDVTENYRKSKL